MRIPFEEGEMVMVDVMVMFIHGCSALRMGAFYY
jgi:hypothetical protein